MNYLQKYQQKLGLTPDGVIGPKTARAMMADLGITSKLFFAHLMGQIAHESGLYLNDRESLNYNSAGLLNIFRTYYLPRPDLVKKHARTKTQKADQKAIANFVYANRNGNGNVASGDGWKYRGIFGLQLTGRTNIIAFIQSLGLPLDTDPDTLLNDPRTYFLAGKFWFEKNGVDKLCIAYDEACITRISKRVNGGINGLEDRIAKTKAMFKAVG